MTETQNTVVTALPTELKKMLKILDSKKAKDITLLEISAQTVIADYFLICEGTSNTHIRSLAGELEYQLSLDGRAPSHMEGYEDGNWILVDFGSIVVHLFNRETRNYYHLEKLWQEATAIDVAAVLAEETKEEEQ